MGVVVGIEVAAGAVSVGTTFVVTLIGALIGISVTWTLAQDEIANRRTRFRIRFMEKAYGVSHLLMSK